MEQEESIHMMEYYSVLKRTSALTHAASGTDLETWGSVREANTEGHRGFHGQDLSTAGHPDTGSVQVMGLGRGLGHCWSAGAFQGCLDVEALGAQCCEGT